MESKLKKSERRIEETIAVLCIGLGLSLLIHGLMMAPAPSPLDARQLWPLTLIQFNAPDVGPGVPTLEQMSPRLTFRPDVNSGTFTTGADKFLKYQDAGITPVLQSWTTNTTNLVFTTSTSSKTWLRLYQDPADGWTWSRPPKKLEFDDAPDEMLVCDETLATCVTLGQIREWMENTK